MEGDRETKNKGKGWLGAVGECEVPKAGVNGMWMDTKEISLIGKHRPIIIDLERSPMIHSYMAFCNLKERHI